MLKLAITAAVTSLTDKAFQDMSWTKQLLHVPPTTPVVYRQILFGWDFRIENAQSYVQSIFPRFADRFGCVAFVEKKYLNPHCVWTCSAAEYALCSFFIWFLILVLLFLFAWGRLSLRKKKTLAFKQSCLRKVCKMCMFLKLFTKVNDETIVVHV